MYDGACSFLWYSNEVSMILIGECEASVSTTYVGFCLCNLASCIACNAFRFYFHRSPNMHGID